MVATLLQHGEGLQLGPDEGGWVGRRECSRGEKVCKLCASLRRRPLVHLSTALPSPPLRAQTDC